MVVVENPSRSAVLHTRPKESVSSGLWCQCLDRGKPLVQSSAGHDVSSSDGGCGSNGLVRLLVQESALRTCDVIVCLLGLHEESIWFAVRGKLWHAPLQHYLNYYFKVFINHTSICCTAFMLNKNMAIQEMLLKSAYPYIKPVVSCSQHTFSTLSNFAEITVSHNPTCLWLIVLYFFLAHKKPFNITVKTFLQVLFLCCEKRMNEWINKWINT